MGIKVARQLEYVYPQQLSEGLWSDPMWRLAIRVDQAVDSGYPKSPLLVEMFWDGADLSKIKYLRALKRTELPLYSEISLGSLEAVAEGMAGTRKGFYKFRTGVGVTPEDPLYAYYTRYDSARAAYDSAEAILATLGYARVAEGDSVTITAFGEVPNRDSQKWRMYPMDEVTIIASGGQGEYSYSLFPAEGDTPGAFIATEATPFYSVGDHVYVDLSSEEVVVVLNPVTGKLTALHSIAETVEVRATDGLTSAVAHISVALPPTLGSSDLTEVQ